MATPTTHTASACAHAASAPMPVEQGPKAGCNRPFHNAHSMPPAVFTSADFEVLEQTHICRLNCLCVGGIRALHEIDSDPTADLDEKAAEDGALHLRIKAASLTKPTDCPSSSTKSGKGACVTLPSNLQPVEEQLAERSRPVADAGMSNYTETFYEAHAWDAGWSVETVSRFGSPLALMRAATYSTYINRSEGGRG